MNVTKGNNFAYISALAEHIFYCNKINRKTEKT